MFSMLSLLLLTERECVWLHFCPLVLLFIIVVLYAVAMLYAVDSAYIFFAHICGRLSTSWMPLVTGKRTIHAGC